MTSCWEEWGSCTRPYLQTLTLYFHSQPATIILCDCILLTDNIDEIVARALPMWDLHIWVNNEKLNQWLAKCQNIFTTSIFWNTSYTLVVWSTLYFIVSSWFGSHFACDLIQNDATDSEAFLLSCKASLTKFYLLLLAFMASSKFQVRKLSNNIWY